MESVIRWKRGDYVRLGRAISRFNKIINEITLLLPSNSLNPIIYSLL